MSIRPSSNDVLLGRGGNNFKHEGNEQLKNLALLRVREYGAATKTEKGFISSEVLQQVKEMGGRFLKKDYEADIWIEVSDVVAREKVCQVLRTFVSAIKDSDSLESDRSSSSSSEGIKSEEEEDGSGADEMCYIRGGGEGEEDQSGLLPRVKDEADGYFNSDDAIATDDVPKKYFITSSAALPIVSGRFESARDNFGVGANHTFASASHSSDFDLFEGELLRSFACDEIFVASSPKDPV